MSLVEKIKKMLRKCKSLLLDLHAMLNFVEERSKKRAGEKIRVGFMCQYIPAWNKSLPIYERLKKDSRFDVFLLCVPNRIEGNILQNPTDLSNDTYEYFIKNGYEAVNLLVGVNQWLDLKSMNLDYIFFTRPYNSFMPKQYGSRVISRYTKICVLLYAMTLSKADLSTMLNRDFFRNVYCYFAETEFSQKVILNSFRIAHVLRLRKTVYYGMPALEDIIAKRDERGYIWDFSKNEYKVLWTPRWTTAAEHGGSNFFKYKEFFTKYAKENKDMDLLIRPHPLTFPNFIKTGEMTESEVNSYKEDIRITKNMCLDENKEYVSTMWESSVLVSDISGMIPEYFVTGKPIIYCVTNMSFELCEHFERLLDGCYKVYNEEQLRACLDNLKAGQDTLKEIRAAIKIQLFGNQIEKSSEMSVNELVDDFSFRNNRK